MSDSANGTDDTIAKVTTHNHGYYGSIFNIKTVVSDKGDSIPLRIIEITVTEDKRHYLPVREGFTNMLCN